MLNMNCLFIVEGCLHRVDADSVRTDLPLSFALTQGASDQFILSVIAFPAELRRSAPLTRATSPHLGALELSLLLLTKK